MICAWNALLDLCSRKLYRQQQTRFDPGLHFHYFFHNEGTAPASVDVVERPPESKIELLLLSPRETLRYLNRLKESELLLEKRRRDSDSTKIKSNLGQTREES